MVTHLNELNHNPLPVCERKVCDWVDYSIFPDPQENVFKRCQICRLVFYKKASSQEYESDYFFTEYENQYGKSYLNDKERIQLRMKWRLDLVQKYLSSSDQTKPRLLEIGSACGFFLELAQKAGFSSEGWEISNAMAKIANQRNLTTKTGDFSSLYKNWLQNKNEDNECRDGEAIIYGAPQGTPQTCLPAHTSTHKKFDVLAAFYVIEHFSEPFIFWEAASNLLKPNGLLVLSLPSIAGPSFLFSKSQWASTHPKDHFVDYSPKSLNMISKAYHFKRLCLKAEGIHPERIPMGSLPFFKNVYKMWQRSFAFSDTIFIIFKKNESN